MSQANQDFRAAINAMNARRAVAIMPKAEGLVGARNHRDPNCQCRDCQAIFQNEHTLRTIPGPLRQPVPDRSMTNAAIAERTLNQLKNAGTNLYREMVGILPVGHRMQEAVRARVLDNTPVLGSCRIGRVPLFRDGNLFTWAEFHLTNFDARLDTRRNRKFYNSASIEEAVNGGAKFYGVAVLTDRFGNTLDFNRNVGDQGLYYQTKDKAIAAYAIAGISTGKSLSELKDLDRNNFLTGKK